MGSLYRTFSRFMVGFVGSTAGVVLYDFGSNGFHKTVGAICVLLGMKHAAGLGRLPVAYSVHCGKKKGHVAYLPLAVLHYIRGLLADHGLELCEQEFLT